MRKRTKLALAGGGIFLVGLLAGALVSGGLPVLAFDGFSGFSSASASTPTKSNYCQLYEQTLAKDLNVSTSQLDQANQSAAKTVIEQMYADGKITAAEKTKLEQALQNGKFPCGAFARGGWHGIGMRGGFGPIGTQARTAIATAVASKLNISEQTLMSDLQAGQTIPQIAQAQKVSLSDVNAAYLGAIKTQLAKAVSSGMITQDQSTKIYNAMQQAVNGGHYPLLEGHERGFRGGKAPAQASTQEG